MRRISVDDIGKLLGIALTGTPKQRDLATRLLVVIGEIRRPISKNNVTTLSWKIKDRELKLEALREASKNPTKTE